MALQPAMSFFQTWTSSKTGTLSEVGVNLAANIVNSNITMTVFRYAVSCSFFRIDLLLMLANQRTNNNYFSPSFSGKRWLVCLLASRT